MVLTPNLWLMGSISTQPPISVRSIPTVQIHGGHLGHSPGHYERNCTSCSGVAEATV